jgi:predicted DNA-binding protein (MmcQ/YjbR family)
MNLERVREFCLSLPHATENVQWGNDLVFKIGGKMFTVASLDAAETKLSFKCTPEEFAELVEQDGIKPADYVARYHWVTLLRWDALPDREIRRLIQQSFEMVRSKLPRAKADGAHARRPATTRSVKTSAAPRPSAARRRAAAKRAK